ncbi:hypothetical protein HYFRA_00000319 [Hymenoscyphus fraxineus]|uniref:Uncharacterized protein n=1 Tax=Hymenoscyphus fraxineus TaxID=746836 RepID=A0A9N9L3M1_9HELO|nr:hypothetical protein HYFRA_00000319 [Hymenoscyphus fraxineus]
MDLIDLIDRFQRDPPILRGAVAGAGVLHLGHFISTSLPIKQGSTTHHLQTHSHSQLLATDNYNVSYLLDESLAREQLDSSSAASVGKCQSCLLSLSRSPQTAFNSIYRCCICSQLSHTNKHPPHPIPSPSIISCDIRDIKFLDVRSPSLKSYPTRSLSPTEYSGSTTTRFCLYDNAQHSSKHSLP